VSRSQPPDAPRRSSGIAAAPYVAKWVVVAPLIGLCSGLGAVGLFEALKLVTHLCFVTIAGARVPTPSRQGALAGSGTIRRPWALPLVVGAGALAGSALVQRFAPEAGGNGTDAAIELAHRAPRQLRIRAVVVRLVSAALTVGSGGSGGQAGPTAFSGAGGASWLSRRFGLNDKDARRADAAGIGAGVGAIFAAPLGATVLGAEILWRRGLEAAILVPCAIASMVAFGVFGAVFGFEPVFGAVGHVHLVAAGQLGWFAAIGLLAGAMGVLYAKGFYGVGALLGRLRVPSVLKPVVGGVIVGVIGIAVPEVLGTGFGWVQESLGRGLTSIPLWAVLAVPAVRVLGTGLTVGSGGSGGVFAPGLVIGAFTGAAVWRLFAPVVPSMGHQPAPYVIAGMMACLGAIARAPIGVTIMVAEMTGGWAVVLPAVVSIGVAWAVVRWSDETIFRSQPHRRITTGVSGVAGGAEATGLTHWDALLHLRQDSPRHGRFTRDRQDDRDGVRGSGRKGLHRRPQARGQP
jgi:H+/Cl- antiporter ClcA